ncbi:hypothetical protein ZWY2020_055136 [Hordeum vulgare]|nr:hypothetical protein ZWY2020_055136 [Hordeum vulgare]
MSSEELLQAQLDLYHHCFVYVKSMALGAATDLRIPRHPPRVLPPCRILPPIQDLPGSSPTSGGSCVLTTSGVFSADVNASGDTTYKLTGSLASVGCGELTPP